MGNKKGLRHLPGPGHTAQGAQLPQAPKLTTLRWERVEVVGRGHSAGTDTTQSYLLLIRSVALGAAPQRKPCCLYLDDFTVNETIEVPEQPLGGGVEDC